MELRANNTTPLLATPTLWRLFTFQTPLSSTAILSQLMSVLAYQSPLFIFIKEHNGNVHKTHTFPDLFKIWWYFSLSFSLCCKETTFKNLIQCFIFAVIFLHVYLPAVILLGVQVCYFYNVYWQTPVVAPGCVANKTTMERLYDISPASVLLLYRDPVSFTAVVTITLSNSSHAEGQGMQVRV